MELLLISVKVGPGRYLNFRIYHPNVCFKTR